MKITPFTEINEDIEKAADWLNDMGLNFLKTRIGEYRKNVGILVDLHEKGNYEEMNRLYPTLVNSLYEASEWMKIYRGLGFLQNQSLVKKLRDFLKGPEWVIDEKISSASNRPRNIAFELLIASGIATNGIEPDFTTHSDIAFPLESKNILVECKRPQSLSAIDKNIKLAAKQLKRRFQSNIRPNVRGIVAVDISKVGNPDFKILETPNTESLNSYLMATVTSFIDSFGYIWNRIKHRKIIGLLVRFSGVAVIKNMNLLTYFQQWGLDPLSKLGSPDYQIAERMGDILRG